MIFCINSGNGCPWNVVPFVTLVITPVSKSTSTSSPASTTTPAGYYAPNKGFKIELNGERDVVSNALTGKLLDTSSFTETDAADRLLIAGTEMDTTALNQLNVTLKNSSTPILPTTGGMGTALFTVGGVALMAVAAWLFFRRKEKKD